mmetsp:Transcript_27433/g.58691  ORF Transcript_27433/g.58691 Transcript_27433/m.58691 type:complete len:221 (-) Transcript_27433:643-1305(-)
MIGSGTMDHLVAATLAVFAGSIVEGILGFGCSLVWMSFFPLFTSVPDAVGVLQPMHIALNVFFLSSMWRRCSPKELKPLALTVPFGIVFGLWIVTSWSSNAIDCVLGLFLIVYTFLKSDDDGHGHPDGGGTDPLSKDVTLKKGVKNGNHSARNRSDLELSMGESGFGEEKKRRLQHHAVVVVSKCVTKGGRSATSVAADVSVDTPASPWRRRGRNGTRPH